MQADKKRKDRDTGITQSQAEQLAQQPDGVCAGAGAVFSLL